MIGRWLAGAVGALILGAAAHVTIEHTGGYHTPHAILTAAIALGVAAGALTIGAAWSNRRYMIALWIALALICGESFGLLRTAERLVEERDRAQAPVAQVEQRRERLADELDRLHASLATLKSSDRLGAALETQAAVAATVAAKSAERGCASNCRKLLEAQVEAASREVAAARAAMDARRTTIGREIDETKAAIAALPASRAASPLAERLGLEAWVLDVLAAVLGSVGANGLGAALLAFSAHQVAVADAQKGTPRATEADYRHIADFASSCLEEASSGGSPLTEIEESYLRWSRQAGEPALPASLRAEVLRAAFDHLGFPIVEGEGGFFVERVKVAPTALRLIEAA